MSNREVVIFGAGNIGRGLVADVVSSAKLRPVLVEANADFLHSLRSAGSYNIHLVGKSPSVRTITGFDLVDANDTASLIDRLTTCEFAVTAVGGENIPKVAPVLAQAIQRRLHPLNILLCENWPHADHVLASELQSKGVSNQLYSCVRCSVERMVRRVDNSIDLLAESGQTVYVDASVWIGDQPNVDGLLLVQDINAYYARKLFTNNAGHALLAYFGAERGCKFLFDALQIPEIRSELDALLDLAGQALVQKYGLDQDAIRDHLDSLVTCRYANQELADTIARVARSPLRKLGPEERLVGLIRLLQSCNLPTEPVSHVIGAALHYYDQDDPESVSLKKMIASDGVKSILGSVCGFDMSESCYNEALHFYEYMKTGGY